VNARLVRNPARRPTARAGFARSDAQTAVRLAGSLFIAWCLPQNWWPWIARQTSWLGGVLGGKSIAGTASRMARALKLNETDSFALAASLRGARYEVAFQALRGFRPGGWHPKIEVTGREHLDAGLAAKKGAVLWVAHFVFAPNAAKIGLHDLGFRVSHLSRPDHGFSSTEFGIRYLNPVRSAFEDRYLAERIVFDRAHPAPALLRARKAVAKNGIVSFTAGAWEGSAVVEADFLESRIALAMGPVWLARASGAALIPVFVVRTRAPDEFRVEIGAPIPLLPGAPEEDCFVAATTDFLQRLHSLILNCPGQWRGWSSLKDA
jgi:hypothetical protein